ncbi:MAG: hypothetical protein JRG82_13720 [Deltaproteobacteria bacterium]|nr:hypothetical protein [Deltaproteobacteria bacterium]
MTWQDGKPVAFDLYYDPVIDHHHLHSPMALTLPAWYLAPQRREVAEVGWEVAAGMHGASGDGPLAGLDDPMQSVALLQLAGEFANADTFERVSNAVDEFAEPTWDRDRGEFSYGFALGEPHPRGQLNARAAAARACSPGAWSRVFNETNAARFDEPTVVGVDFPTVALSRAHWDAERGELHVTAVPQNESVRGTRTRFRVTNVRDASGWTMTGGSGGATPLSSEGGDVVIDTTVDGRPRVIRAP